MPCPVPQLFHLAFFLPAPSLASSVVWAWSDRLCPQISVHAFDLWSHEDLQCHRKGAPSPGLGVPFLILPAPGSGERSGNSSVWPGSPCNTLASGPQRVELRLLPCPPALSILRRSFLSGAEWWEGTHSLKLTLLP